MECDFLCGIESMAFVLWKTLYRGLSKRRDIISQAFTINSLGVYYPKSIVVPIHILISHWTYHIHTTPFKTDLNAGVFSFNLLGVGRSSVRCYLLIEKKTFAQFCDENFGSHKYAMINCVTAPKTRLFYGLSQTSYTFHY